MSQNQKNLLHCYNRGCGQIFDPDKNIEENCIHHPGYPVFHDAYKGWSCCNKKCIDFTEFLNIKGCTKSRHSNVKQPLPEKLADQPQVCSSNEITIQPLNNESTLKRPEFDSPQITLKPTISKSLAEQIKGLIKSLAKSDSEIKVQIGQSCQNNCCTATYQGPTSDEEICIYHPDVPIFHEGMKYWSCCQKKTTDFSKFLEQPGCTQGKHVWISKDSSKKTKCRMDWHQTGAFIVVSVYAKKYLPDKSIIKLNPIRLTVDLFLIEDNSRYNLDLELQGVVDITQSSVNMFPTKVEIQLKKAELGSWVELTYPRPIGVQSDNTETNEDSKVDALDLSDL